MIVYFWSFSDNFTSSLQYYWATGMMFLLAVRLVIYRASFKTDFYVKSNKWLLIYTGITFLLGVMWGLVTLIPVEYLQGELLTLTLVTLLLALCCISAISSSAHTYVIWAFLLPIALFSTVYLIKANSEEYGTIMGIGALTFCIVAGLIGQSLHRMIVSALFLQNRNSSLMDEVVQIAKQNQKSYEGFQLLLDNLGAGAAMFDRNHRMISWNKSFENIFNLPTGLVKRGMTLKEVIRKIIKQSWQNNVDVNHAADAHIKEILQEKNEDDLVKLVMADGRNLYSKVMKISDDQLVLNYTDVTSLEQARTDDIIHVLQHDSLTGLPNQVLHKKEVRKRIVDFRRDAAKNEKLKDEQFMALVYFGLNSLNEIYEFLGLSAGDQVVTEIANRCKEFFQDDVHLSHVAYDEFHIITSNENNLDEVLELVEELNKILAAPIKIGENSIEMTISVGISIYPDHADKTDHINRNAKIAYNKAMLTNAYSVVVYDHGMHSEIMERTNMLFDIRDSISKSQFLLHYQPQISIDDRQINGVEALLRWQHPDKGWISPDDFIPLAEHTKQIIPLTEQFLPEACYQAKKWQDQGLEPFKMAVNISPFHFHEKDFPKFVRNCLEAVKLDPEYLDLEITEGVIMNQTEEIIRILHELSEMGVQLSIDDFGTGYSSLSYLRSLPVDKLKIDQSFIRDMDQDKSAHSLVEAIIRLGHSFNLNVIAEGVETEDQLKKLATMRCDLAQGFYIKRPDTADEITKWIKSNNA